MKLNSHILKLCALSSISLLGRVDGGVSVEATFASQAFDRGIAEADLNWQTSVEFGFGDFYVGAWALMPVENKAAPDFFSERYEVYLGKGWAIADKVGFDAGLIRSVNPRVSDTTEAFLGVFAEFGTFSPSLYIYNDFDLERWVAEAATTISIPLDLFPVDATARLGVVEADFDYSYFELDLIYPVELSDAALLSLGLHYSDNDFGGGVPDGNFYGSASVRLKF